MKQLPDCDVHVVMTRAEIEANQAILRGIQ
jgi:hypothetical protein